MNLTEIKKELSSIKECLTKQTEYLERCIEYGNIHNKLIDDKMKKYLDDYFAGKNNIPVPDKLSGLNLKDLNSVTQELKNIYNDPNIIFYDSFIDMNDEINAIRDTVANTGVPENMENRQQEIIGCYDDITSSYNYAISDNIESITDIINLMNTIINNISEII
ncbi:MAG: hypothetical protein K2L10_04675 [Ruminococcus sp.]|nr:hypothetical protein [Ruminococcus sp.]